MNNMRKLMLKLVLVFLFVCTLKAQPLEMAEQSKKPLLRMGLPLANNTDNQRFQTFIIQNNKKIVENVNSDPTKSYKLQLNGFAKLTQQEIKQRYLSLIPSSEASIGFAKAVINAQKKPVLENKFVPKAGMNIASFAAPSISRTFQPDPIQPSLSYQNSILDDVKEFFRKKNISNSTIQNGIISKYKYQGPPAATDPAPNRRMLQVQESDIRKMRQNDKLIKINDVDWSCVSGRVKAQGDCGACYAFATADNVGAILGIYHFSFFIQLSIQQLIDCTQNSLAFGCNGGFLEGSLAQLTVPGVFTEMSYPYSSIDLSKVKSSQCKTNVPSQIRRFKIQNFQLVKKGDCEDLKLQLQKHPVSIGIAGYKLAFYSEGVFDGCDQDDVLDHAALLVGWKKGKGWKVKNSWGTRWGEKGFIWLKQGNTCKLCEVGFYPIAARGKGYDKYMKNEKYITCPPPV